MDECFVSSGEVKVYLIKDVCLSKALNVEQLPDDTEDAASGALSLSGFTYSTFVIDGAASKEQQITCSVKICQKGSGMDIDLGCAKSAAKNAPCDNTQPYFFNHMKDTKDKEF